MEYMRSNSNILIGILFAVGIMILFVTVGNSETARGETIIVAKDGSGDYIKIQDAIDNATDGDELRVYEGTYFENVVVNKTLSLVGNGSEETTIDGGGEGNVVEIISDWCNMSCF